MQRHRDRPIRDSGAAEEVDGDDGDGDADGAGEAEPDDGARDDEAQELPAGEEQRGPDDDVDDVPAAGPAAGLEAEPLHDLAGDRVPHHPGARPRHRGGPHHLVQPRLQ